jgi:hypothetical protein
VVQQDEDADHQIVQQFFAERELIAERIVETVTKTPDFRIRRGEEIVAFCEVKSPQDVFSDRVTDAIRAGHAGIIETGYGNDYRQARCIERAALKAEAQFMAVNASHAVPNILIIVNHDTVSLYDDFSQAITGEIGTLGPGSVGDAVRDKVPQIDGYVWIDASGRTAAKPQRLFRHESPLKETVRKLLQLG